MMFDFVKLFHSSLRARPESTDVVKFGTVLVALSLPHISFCDILSF
jgi:hypothetical protein